MPLWIIIAYIVGMAVFATFILNSETIYNSFADWFGSMFLSVIALLLWPIVGIVAIYQEWRPR